jgi:hypothetical protein
VPVPVQVAAEGDGGAIVRIGATVHPTAPDSVTLVTTPPVIVAVAVGLVAQTHPVTVTTGTEVYPDPPAFVGIVAVAPETSDTAVAVVPPDSPKVIVETF